MKEQIDPTEDEQLEDISGDQAAADKKQKPEDRKGPKFVVITVDRVEHRVRKGKYVVSVLKDLTGVDPAYQLEQVLEDGQFKPLEDTDKIKIKGREVFISHPRTGAAS